MRFLPHRIKRMIWGLVGDYVNGMVMVEDMLNELMKKHAQR